MTNEMTDKYAGLLLDALNLSEDQELVVAFEPVHEELAARVAAAAYDRGARYVLPWHGETYMPSFHRARILHARKETLDSVSGLVSGMYDSIVDGNRAYLVIFNMEDPQVFDDLDVQRLSRARSSYYEGLRKFYEAVSAGTFKWLGCYAPTAMTAGKILGMDSGPAAVEKMWEVLIPILGLDREDPFAWWEEKIKLLKTRMAHLDELDFAALRLTAPRTDLRVGLGRGRQWDGGSWDTPDGGRFLPNLPTEEVFTSPDPGDVAGTVRVTRPVRHAALAGEVTGVSFTFEEGRVVDYRAETGEDRLKGFLDTDEGARRLGEIALVDGGSPLYESGLIFDNVLLDENAASHIALGRGFPDCLRDDGDRVNASKVHVDFMIGGPDMDIDGECRDGSIVPVMRAGRLRV